jgi:hypothetical protein
MTSVSNSSRVLHALASQRPPPPPVSFVQCLCLSVPLFALPYVTPPEHTQRTSDSWEIVSSHCAYRAEQSAHAIHKHLRTVLLSPCWCVPVRFPPSESIPQHCFVLTRITIPGCGEILTNGVYILLLMLATRGREDMKRWRVRVRGGE